MEIVNLPYSYVKFLAMTPPLFSAIHVYTPLNLASVALIFNLKIKQNLNFTYKIYNSYTCNIDQNTGLSRFMVLYYYHYIELHRKKGKGHSDPSAIPDGCWTWFYCGPVYTVQGTFDL